MAEVTSENLSVFKDLIEKLESMIATMTVRTTATKEDRTTTTGEGQTVLREVAQGQDVHVDELAKTACGGLMQLITKSATDLEAHTQSLRNLELSGARASQFALGLAQLQAVTGQGKMTENLEGINATDALESMMIGALRSVPSNEAQQVLNKVAENLK